MYAKIYIEGTQKGAITGLNGEYRIDGLCDGPMELIVSHVGCGTNIYQIEIEENTHFDVALPHSNSHADTVHIHHKHPGLKPTQAETIMEAEELQQQAGRTLGEAMKGLVGVDALQTGPSIFKPMIHGLHSNRVLILNNGYARKASNGEVNTARKSTPLSPRN